MLEDPFDSKLLDVIIFDALPHMDITGEGQISLAKEIKEDFWMYWTLRILGTLILTIIGVILLIVIIVLMVVLESGGDAGAFDLPIGGGGTKSKKPKRIHEKTSHYQKRISKK